MLSPPPPERWLWAVLRCLHRCRSWWPTQLCPTRFLSALCRSSPSQLALGTGRTRPSQFIRLGLGHTSCRTDSSPCPRTEDGTGRPGVGGAVSGSRFRQTPCVQHLSGAPLEPIYPALSTFPFHAEGYRSDTKQTRKSSGASGPSHRTPRMSQKVESET